MNRKVFCWPVWLILLIYNELSSQTVWTGAVSNNWGAAANWSNGLPAPTNDATIPAAPNGMFFPTVSVFIYFDFNVQNYGVLNVSGSSGATLFGTLINHAGASMVVGGSNGNFLVESTGIFENHGVIFNNGTFKNEGSFTNAANGNFGNSNVFTHADGAFLNTGVFDNFGQFFSEADFLNAGTFNNHNFFNNNQQLTNADDFNSFFGATLRNDKDLLNQNAGSLDIEGEFINNHIFLNQGSVNTKTGSVSTNNYLARNAIAASWTHQGMMENVFCAIFENKGIFQNTLLLENEGFIYADQPIAPVAPVNVGSGTVIEPGNPGILCHDTSVWLAAPSNTATVTALDLANNQFDFCAGWGILANGQPTLTYTGCASLGPQSVSVSFLDPFGRTTLCPSTVTVLENIPPVIACQPPLSLTTPPGQCSVAATLVPPTILSENCGVASIVSTAPASFPPGITNVVWTVADLSGNAATCVQQVAVFDLLPPAITCPGSKTVNAAAGLCGVSSQIPAISADPAVATDNCGILSVANSAGAVLPVGANTLTWTATDVNGNTTSCQQSVTVIDNQPPQITQCPPNMVVPTQINGCQAVATWNPTLATDNCAVASQASAPASGSIFPLGLTQVTVTVQDASSNSAACQFSVTVQDDEPPVFTGCPSDSTIFLADCNDAALGNWSAPVATDPCLDVVTSNFKPGDVLPIGSNTVVYNALDASGNSASCSFTVTVQAGVALDCPADIVVSVPSGQTISTVAWNPPPGTVHCSVCASVNLAGFLFLGEMQGHRYYLHLGGGVGWAEAQTIASQMGGYLVSVADAAENEFLRKEFPSQFQDAWLGFSDETTEGQFTWSSGEAANFSNWKSGTAPANDLLDYAVFQPDGTWVDDSLTALHTLLLEVPCYAIDVLASDPAALNSLVFPLGTTTIFYDALDACGNTCSCSFEVQVVQNQQVDPCVASGNPAFGWIESVSTEGFDNASGNDGGRGDFTGTLRQLPDPGCFLRLEPGGPATDAYLYWRIWADLNKDGDFYDSDEILASAEGVGEQHFCYDLPTALPTGPVGLRVAMSRWGYAAACGDFAAGEDEDYLVEFVDSSLFDPGSCAWQFGLFDGQVADLKVELHWLGSGNCDVVRFLVEKSADGLQFAIDGEVLPASLEFIDKTPFYGINFYRIRAVLEDGTEVVSGVFEVDFNVDFESIFLYPNPASAEVILHVFPFSGKAARIFLADAKGQMMLDEYHEVLENEPIRFDLTGYPTGIYSVYLKAEGEREQVRRFIIGAHK